MIKKELILTATNRPQLNSTDKITQFFSIICRNAEYRRSITSKKFITPNTYVTWKRDKITTFISGFDESETKISDTIGP